MRPWRILTGMEGIGKESAVTFLKKREEILTEIEKRPTGMILKNRVLRPSSASRKVSSKNACSPGLPLPMNRSRPTPNG